MPTQIKRRKRVQSAHSYPATSGRRETDSLAQSEWIIHDTVPPSPLSTSAYKWGSPVPVPLFLLKFLVNVGVLPFPSIQNIQDGVPQAEEAQSDSRLYVFRTAPNSKIYT
jgi:hypothetical protein